MSTRENIRLIARSPLAFVIISARENIRLITRASLQPEKFGPLSHLNGFHVFFS